MALFSNGIDKRLTKSYENVLEAKEKQIIALYNQIEALEGKIRALENFIQVNGLILPYATSRGSANPDLGCIDTLRWEGAGAVRNLVCLGGSIMGLGSYTDNTVNATLPLLTPFQRFLKLKWLTRNF